MAHRDLGSWEGLLDVLGAERRLFTDDDDGAAVARRLAEELAAPRLAEPAVARGSRWTAEGVDGLELSWDVGYGPRTQAWLLRPAGERGTLPGAVALHCHSGMKYRGKEKIADGPQGVLPDVQALRDECYSGTAFANELAREGYAVLVHDVTGWGSRRFDVADMPGRSEDVARMRLREAERDRRDLTVPQVYDVHAGAHEDALAKTLGVLGTSFGGLVAAEDLVAARVLAGLDGTAPGGVAVVGLSGGGARASLATALSAGSEDVAPVRAAVVASMMSTMDHVLDGYLHAHTWMLMTPGLARVADLPDIAGAAAPRPLFVGYAERDALFPIDGMRAADRRLAQRYADAGSPDAYEGVFVDAPHSFGDVMRRRAWDFLDRVMR